MRGHENDITHRETRDSAETDTYHESKTECKPNQYGWCDGGKGAGAGGVRARGEAKLKLRQRPHILISPRTRPLIE